MPRVRLRLFATVREAAGRSDLEVDASDITHVLSELSRAYGPKMSRLLSSADHAGDRIVVLVNGRNIAQLDGLGTKLRDGDEVAIFPPVSGG